jgi:PadR family transcriptional regulator PadR
MNGRGGRRCGGSRDFLEACILFILKKGPLHGYEIVKSLDRFGLGGGAIGPHYCILNKMEETGLVISRWDTDSKFGPARRVYSITEDGGIYLATVVGNLQDTVDRMSCLIDEFRAHKEDVP